MSLPALGCPHQQPVGDGMKQPPCPGGLTTILPLSGCISSYNLRAVVLRVTSKRGALPPFPEFCLQASKAAGSSWAASSQGCGQVEGNEAPIGKLCGFFKRKSTRNETDSGRGSNTTFYVSNTSQGAALLGRSNTCSVLFLQGVENLRTSDVGC